MKGRIIRQEQIGSSAMLPRIGQVKVGMKAMSKSGKEYPTSVDYFVPSGKYAALFTKAYGEKPQTIQIVFMSDDAQQACNEHYEYRGNDGCLYASGDGEEFRVWDGNKYIKLTTQECPTLMESIAKRYPSRTGWKVTLTMQFLIPAIKGVLGLWQFTTKGDLSTIPSIRSTFDAFMEQKGTIKGIIFDMNVQFAKSQKPDSKSKFPVVTIVANESEENREKIKWDNISHNLLVE